MRRVANDETAVAEGRSKWTSCRRYYLDVVAVTLFACVGNFLWISRYSQLPSWDQAGYLDISYHWRHALLTGGLGSAIQAIYHYQPGYPPLYMLTISPLQALRATANSADIVNTFFLAGTVVAAAVIAVRLFGRRAALPTAILTATCPLIYGLSRTPLVDILLTFTCTLTVMAAVISDGFLNHRWSIACGACAGLAFLTKITAPGILVVPIACTFLLPKAINLRKQFLNLGLAVIAMGLVALPWYAFELGSSITYLRGGLFLVGGISNPLNPTAIVNYMLLVINDGTGTILVCLLLLVTALLSGRMLHNKTVTRSQLVAVVIPSVWLLIPFGFELASHNQQTRFLAPSIVAVAILCGGGLATVRPRALSTGLTVGSAALLAWQFVAFIYPFGNINLMLGDASHNVEIPLDGAPLPFVGPPTRTPPYAVPIVEQIRKAATRLRLTSGLDVCLFETQAVVNANTLRFVGELHGLVDVNFTDLSYIPNYTSSQLVEALRQCPVALYMSPAQSEVSGGQAAVINASSAASKVTPADLAMFNGPQSTFPVGVGLTVRIFERRTAA